MATSITACRRDLPAGFAFFREDDEHLHFVGSDANQPQVVVFSLTTVRWGCDTSCVISKGEHPFVQHPTCVAYYYADIVITQDIAEGVNQGVLSPQMPLSDDLMERVWNGAGRTDQLPLACREILVDQGLIPG